MWERIVAKLRLYFGFVPDWKDHPPCAECGKPVKSTVPDEGWLWAQPCGHMAGHDPRPFLQCTRCNFTGFGEVFDIDANGDGWACPQCGMDESGIDFL